tara:strand:+ start:4421 stop:5320 length:900 start_codon:yes stop_codon:yes gene_type:complete
MISAHTFKGGDASDAIANLEGGQVTTLQFWHVPTEYNVIFKAFLTTFTDSYSSNWSEEDVFGRNDPLTMFQGTKRNISVAWDVVANGIDEAIHNLQRVSELASMLYPVYEQSDQTSGTNVVVASPLFKVKFANLISDAISQGPLTCRLSGLEHAPVIDSGFFHQEGMGMLFPKVINLSCDLTILHSHPLGWQKGKKKGHTFRARRDNTQGFFPYGTGYDSRVRKPTPEEQAKNLSQSEKDKKSNVAQVEDATGSKQKKDVHAKAQAKKTAAITSSTKGAARPRNGSTDPAPYPPTSRPA